MSFITESFYSLADTVQQANNVDQADEGPHTDTEILQENLPSVTTVRKALPLGVLVVRRSLTLLAMFIILALGIVLSVLVKT